MEWAALMAVRQVPSQLWGGDGWRLARRNKPVGSTPRSAIEVAEVHSALFL